MTERPNDFLANIDRGLDILGLLLGIVVIVITSPFWLPLWTLGWIVKQFGYRTWRDKKFAPVV